MKLIFLILTLVLFGCTNPLPSPIVEPDKDCIDGGSTCDNFADGLSSFNAVVNAYRGYATIWERTADKKKQQATAADEITFYGLLASAIGLATKSPETVIAGGSVGAAGSIYSHRYSLEVQSHNYDLASQAVQCMYMAALPYKNGNFSNEENVRSEALASLVNVRKKLRSLQNNLVLGTPSFSELQSALNYTPKHISTATTSGRNIPDSIPDEEVTKLLQEIKVCESQIG